MIKFDIKIPKYAFISFNQMNYYLFEFGGNDICTCKENYKIQSYCEQHSFSYKGISNALCGKEFPECFTLQQIIVIEMK
ncbi:hypothetical protein KM1_083340 [Entamoeba histolytica HM-3:IMSS]|uniref:Uncharacterized protein n=1 Tax=Entamoeba histolytica HM-3:IMSS TaxID=885315 RepID=M7WT42_ENTHI|nr:hypothetical protein KM1_083340 [Entamoeba histolytica HM-3:IMSS]